MSTPSNINLVPLNGENPTGQGYIKQARSPIQQFLLNVFGEWNEHKPQLFKDIPVTDMITLQLAYATGQGNASISPLVPLSGIIKTEKPQLKK